MTDSEMSLEDKIKIYREIEENRKGIIQMRKEAENYASMCLMFIFGIIVGVSGSIFASSILNIMKLYHIIDASAAIISFGILLFFGWLFYRQYKRNLMGAGASQWLLDWSRPLRSEIEKELKTLKKK